MSDVEKNRRKRFLLVSPMANFGPFLPLNISILVSVLKSAGFEVRLFDTTFYEIPSYAAEKDVSSTYSKLMVFKPVDWAGYSMDELKTDYVGDFKKQITEFNPDFIGVSIFTSFNEKLAFEFIDNIGENYSGKVIVGGMHVKIDPARFYQHPRIDALILGECEDTLEEVMDFLEFLPSEQDRWEGECNIPNFAFRANGKWHVSSKETISDIAQIPCPDWSLFDDRNFYRPFDGKILRMGHVEVSRGCPYGCTYCINETMHKRFRGEQKYYRIKNIAKVLDEVNRLVQDYKLEAIKIWDDDLFAIPLNKFSDLCAGLKKIGVPFLCHARPESISSEKAKIAADAGCIQVGIGVESGNELYRRKHLKRFMKNNVIAKGFDLLKEHKIVRTAYCMIGMPDETREDIFETIKLLRRIKPDVVVQAIFVPYKGNTLYDYAEEKGYLAHLPQPYDYSFMFRPYLKMPTIRDKELIGLNKTFNLHTKFPGAMYPFIRLAEKENRVGNFVFSSLAKVINQFGNS